MSKMAARIVKINTKTLYNIIKEVRKRPCLWNTDHEYYNNRGRVAIAWEEITEVLHLPEALVRAKWKNMRDLFKREMKKCNIESLDEYEGKWRHFKAMWFLHKPNEQVPINETTAEDSSPEPQIKQESDVFGLPDTTDVEVFIEEGDENAPLDGRNLSESEFDQEPKPIKKRRVSEEDYDMMFLKSLAPYFRELHPIRKLTIRNKIQDIILNEINAQASHSKLPRQ